MDKNLKQTKDPAISIIMAAYNVEKYIDEAVASVLAQTFEDFELIIVNNASTDSTLKHIQEWAGKDPRIKYLSNIENGTPSSARNAAVKIALGKYFAVLDSDDAALPERLQKQFRFMEANPKVAALGGGAIIMDQNGKILGTKTKPSNFCDIKFAMLLQYQFMNSSIMFRRSAFEAVGGYPNSAAEDYAMVSLMIEKGYEVTNLPEPLIKFRTHAASWTMLPETSVKHAKAALAVTLRNVRPYIEDSEDEVMNMVNMMNAKNISLGQTFKALKLYRKLTYSYMKLGHLAPEEKKRVLEIYRNKVKGIIIWRIKKLL